MHGLFRSLVFVLSVSLVASHLPVFPPATSADPYQLASVTDSTEQEG
jgi:hypothetical protein